MSPGLGLSGETHEQEVMSLNPDTRYLMDISHINLVKNLY